MRKIEINKIYKHYKGNYYLVLDVGKNTENCEDVVIYRALYENNQVWVRPLKEFLSEVDHEKFPNVKQKYRFELQRFEDKRKS